MPPFLVDSHCHLNLIDLDPFPGGVREVLDDASAQGVGHVLCVSIDLVSFPTILGYADADARVSVSVGVHPNGNPQAPVSLPELLRLADDPRVVAIGETGLDYYRSKGDLDWQRQRFRIHIRAARECGKPLIIHCREAGPDVMKILEEEKASEVSGVMHCFVDDFEIAQRAMNLGFAISFSGIVTFKNALQIREVSEKVPLDSLLVETDAPYLAPVPYRGKPNRPGYVRHVAECIADLKQIPLESVVAATTRNFFRVFPAGKPGQGAP
jgi:TatD DNase family protein